MFQISSVEECLNSASMECPVITEEDCDYNGKYIVEIKANDDRQCQQICIDCRYPDCGYWSFIKSEKNCILWELPNKNCITIGGSDEPSLLTCLGIYGVW